MICFRVKWNWRALQVLICRFVEFLLSNGWHHHSWPFELLDLRCAGETDDIIERIGKVLHKFVVIDVRILINFLIRGVIVIVRDLWYWLTFPVQILFILVIIYVNRKLLLMRYYAKRSWLHKLGVGPEFRTIKHVKRVFKYLCGWERYYTFLMLIKMDGSRDSYSWIAFGKVLIATWPLMGVKENHSQNIICPFSFRYTRSMSRRPANFLKTTLVWFLLSRYFGCRISSWYRIAYAGPSFPAAWSQGLKKSSYHQSAYMRFRNPFNYRIRSPRIFGYTSFPSLIRAILMATPVTC